MSASVRTLLRVVDDVGAWAAKCIEGGGELGTTETLALGVLVGRMEEAKRETREALEDLDVARTFPEDESPEWGLSARLPETVSPKE